MIEKMESGKKKPAALSFANELFGPNDSSAGGFGSIFAPPSNSNSKSMIRREAHGSEVVDQKNSSQARQTDEGQSSGNKSLNAILGGERGLFHHHPCNLSSSIYYGGQDVYSSAQGDHTSSSSYKKGVEDDDDDDPHSASRGDWWQGSVYY